MENSNTRNVHVTLGNSATLLINSKDRINWKKTVTVSGFISASDCVYAVSLGSYFEEQAGFYKSVQYITIPNLNTSFKALTYAYICPEKGINIALISIPNCVKKQASTLSSLVNDQGETIHVSPYNKSYDLLVREPAHILFGEEPATARVYDGTFANIDAEVIFGNYPYKDILVITDTGKSSKSNTINVGALVTSVLTEKKKSVIAYGIVLATLDNVTVSGTVYSHTTIAVKLTSNLQAIQTQLIHFNGTIQGYKMPSFESAFDSSTENYGDGTGEVIETGSTGLRKNSSYDNFEFKCGVQKQVVTSDGPNRFSISTTNEKNGGHGLDTCEGKTSPLAFETNTEDNREASNPDFNFKLIQKMKDGRYLRHFLVGPKGGICSIPGMGVCLCIPPKALDTEQYIFIGLSKNGHDIPDLMDGSHLYSPIFVCGPHGLKFNKMVYLVFQHSLVIQSKCDDNLPVLFHSETTILEETSWQEYTNAKPLVSWQLVMAPILSFTKYTLKTIGDSPRCKYRILRAMVFLETIQTDVERARQRNKHDAVCIHIHVMDAEDSEEEYAMKNAQGTFQTKDTFFLNEKLKSNLSVQVIPNDSYEMTFEEVSKIIEFSDIQDNRQGLLNHTSFHLNMKTTAGEMQQFKCQVRLTQLDGYSKMFDVLSPIQTSASRDSGFDDSEVGATASTPLSNSNTRSNSNRRHGMVPRQSFLALDTPSTCMDSTSTEPGVNSEKHLCLHIKPGIMQEFILPPQVREKLEKNMPPEATAKLAKHMQIVEPELWEAKTVLFFFEVTKSGFERQEAIKELHDFFLGIKEEKLASICSSA